MNPLRAVKFHFFSTLMIIDHHQTTGFLFGFHANSVGRNREKGLWDWGVPREMNLGPFKKS